MKSRTSLQAISVLQAWEPLQVSGKERHGSLGGLAGALWLRPGEQIAGQESGSQEPGSEAIAAIQTRGAWPWA